MEATLVLFDHNRYKSELLPAVRAVIERDVHEAKRHEAEERRQRKESEARCRDELQSFDRHDPRRRRVADVFRALRWT